MIYQRILVAAVMRVRPVEVVVLGGPSLRIAVGQARGIEWQYFSVRGMLGVSNGTVKNLENGQLNLPELLWISLFDTLVEIL